MFFGDSILKDYECLAVLVILEKNHFCERCMDIETGQGQFLWRSLQCPIILPFHVLNFSAKVSAEVSEASNARWSIMPLLKLDHSMFRRHVFTPRCKRRYTRLTNPGNRQCLFKMLHKIINPTGNSPNITKHYDPESTLFSRKDLIYPHTFLYIQDTFLYIQCFSLQILVYLNSKCNGKLNITHCLNYATTLKYLSEYLCLCVCLPVCQLVIQSVSQSVSLSICLVYVRPSICPSICLSVCLCIYLSIYLSI